MASVKVILRKEVKNDGTSPLAIRITKNRKSSYIYLEYSVKEKDWDKNAQRVKRSHSNSTRLNNFILTKLTEANSKALETEAGNNNVSSKAVSEKIKPKHKNTFLSFAQTYLETLKNNGKYNRYTPDKSRINRFSDFLQLNGLGSDIAFTEITPQLIKRFQTYLKGLKISERTIVNYLIVIRTIFNQAIDAELVDRKYYPFGKGKIVIKTPETIKIGLTAEEVKHLEEVKLPDGSFENHCRNLWLFSFYFAGMRISDVFRVKWSDIQNDRLHYAMGKNNKVGSLKIPDKALSIIEQYRADKQHKNDFIFPDLKDVSDKEDKFLMQRRIINMTSRVDKALRNKVASAAHIDKKLTMHIARHTFGNLSGDKIPLQMLQKLYRHSSITTTIGYQANFIHKDADDALESVISI